jgi:hypothetical protein
MSSRALLLLSAILLAVPGESYSSTAVALKALFTPQQQMPPFTARASPNTHLKAL